MSLERLEALRLLTPREVAAIFRVDHRTVNRWADEGRLHTIRTPGGQRRYLAAEVAGLSRIKRGESGA